MSSPLVKISEMSWSLSCLCCNCAQEVRDTLRMEVGPAFVEYNHRFTCPECQTYNQILLTRVMFDTAQVMILPSMNQNQPPSRNDSPLGYSPGAPPSYEEADEAWSAIDPPPESSPFGTQTDSSPFGSPSSSDFNPPVGSNSNENNGGGHRPGIPSFEAAAPAPPVPAAKMKPAPPLPVAPPKPARNFAKNDNSIGGEDFDALNKLIDDKGKAGGRKKSKEAGQSGGIKLPGGLQIPLNLQTAVVAVAFLVSFAGGYYLFSRRPAPPPEPAPAAKKPAATAAAPVKNPEPAKPVTVTLPTVPLVEAKMVEIPGGEYIIGRSEGGEYERPSHKVTLKPFQIDVREVTREEYAKFIAETGHKAPKSWTGGQYKGSGRLPVTDVDWSDAAAYAKWAGKRLPTEAEWETASSGKDHLLYPWGNEWADNKANTREVGTDGPQPAGTFGAGRSQFGLYDMVGNVWEWTDSEPESYPGSSMRVANSKDLRVIRGGAYNEAQKVATTSARNWVEATTTSPALGFRCAKDVQ